MRLLHPRFGATAAGVVVDEEGRVLLLKHVFRPGSGWGLPGGFLESGEQPEAALRRELEEEVGLELDKIELFTVRTFKKPKQLEVVFRCKAAGKAKSQSMEVKTLGWFAPGEFPEGLPVDQRRLIQSAIAED
jgi:8-oxo-dGTP diphosphatase